MMSLIPQEEVLTVVRKKSGLVRIERERIATHQDRVSECVGKSYLTVEDALLEAGEAAYWERQAGRPYPTHWRNCYGEVRVLEI